MKTTALASALFVLVGVVSAQESPNFELSSYSFNSAGIPAAGTNAESTNFQITLAGAGGATAEMALTSSSFTLAAGFASPYPPPAEIAGVVFNDKQTLQWDPEASIGVYNLYRDLISNLVALGFGNCEQLNLAGEIATDNVLPPTNDGFFYLVTAENLLAEEGTKGFHGDGTEREGAVCP